MIFKIIKFKKMMTQTFASPENYIIYQVVIISLIKLGIVLSVTVYTGTFQENAHWTVGIMETSENFQSISDCFHFLRSQSNNHCAHCAVNLLILQQSQCSRVPEFSNLIKTDLADCDFWTSSTDCSAGAD